VKEASVGETAASEPCRRVIAGRCLSSSSIGPIKSLCWASNGGAWLRGFTAGCSSKGALLMATGTAAGCLSGSNSSRSDGMVRRSVPDDVAFCAFHSCSTNDPNLTMPSLKTCLCFYPLAPPSLVEEMRAVFDEVLYYPLRAGNEYHNDPETIPPMPTGEELARVDTIFTFALPPGLTAEQMPNVRLFTASGKAPLESGRSSDSSNALVPASTSSSPPISSNPWPRPSARSCSATRVASTSRPSASMS
jgi:hypothetical protein